MRVRKRRQRRKRVRRKVLSLWALGLLGLTAITVVGNQNLGTLSRNLELEAVAEAADVNTILANSAAALSSNLFNKGQLSGLGLLGGEYFLPAVALGEVDLTATNGEEVAPAPVPEPASFMLIGSGLIGLIGMRRWKRQSRDHVVSAH